MKLIATALLSSIAINSTHATTIVDNGVKSWTERCSTQAQVETSANIPSLLSADEYEHDRAFVTTPLKAEQYEHDGAFANYRATTMQAPVVPYSNTSVAYNEYEHDGALVNNHMALPDYEHDGAFVSYRANVTYDTPGEEAVKIDKNVLNQAITIADLVRFISTATVASSRSID